MSSSIIIINSPRIKDLRKSNERRIVSLPNIFLQEYHRGKKLCLETLRQTGLGGHKTLNETSRQHSKKTVQRYRRLKRSQ